MARPVRAQMSIEFVMLAAIILLVFSMVALSYYRKSGEAVLMQADISAKMEVQKAANEMNSALLAGDGYSKRILLPARLYTTHPVTFRLYPQGRSIWANYSASGTREVHAQVLGPALNGSMGNGSAVLQGYVRIRNVNGSVVASNE